MSGPKVHYEPQIGYGKSPCCAVSVVRQGKRHFCTWCQGEVPPEFWLTVRITVPEGSWTSSPVVLHDATRMEEARQEAFRQVSALRSALEDWPTRT